MKKFALIVAGGTGTRMGSGIPKQFLLLDGIPVLMHTLKIFFDADPATKLILALPGSQFQAWRKLCSEFSFSLEHQLSPGGATRYESVKNALSLLTADGFVAIHDGVRPLASRDLIDRAFETASLQGSAVPVIPVRDSVRTVGDGSSRPFDRTSLRLVQTPQVFRSELILDAYQKAVPGPYTDDASVLEAAGIIVHLIDGEPYNLKITFPEDLALAESLIRLKQGRTG